MTDVSCLYLTFARASLLGEQTLDQWKMRVVDLRHMADACLKETDVRGKKGAINTAKSRESPTCVAIMAIHFSTNFSTFQRNSSGVERIFNASSNTKLG